MNVKRFNVMTDQENAMDVSISDLVMMTEKVNSGKCESVIDIIANMFSYGSCALCGGKTKVKLHANERGLWVGACPYCDCTIFYIGLPFLSCGKIGPIQLCYSEDSKFYYRIEHLGELYVEIEKDG